MGGPGSGNRVRWGAKASTEACQRLDLSSLHQGGWLRPGSCGTARWRRGERVTSSIGWTVDGEAGTATVLELRYAVGGEVIRYAVPIAWTACRFGGRRPWFVCPGAGTAGPAGAPQSSGKERLHPHLPLAHGLDVRFRRVVGAHPLHVLLAEAPSGAPAPLRRGA